MKLKFIILPVFLLIISEYVSSQTILTSNLYNQNKYMINPAYAGSMNYLEAYINYRNTASSIQGTPSFISIGANMPVYRKMSLGARFTKQTEGLFDIISSYADYSYRVEIAKGHQLRFGISAGITSNQINYSDIIAEDPSAVIDVASRNFEGISFQSAAGVVYSWSNFEWSLALPQLFESKNNFKPYLQSLSFYKFNLVKKSVILIPSFFLSYKANNPLLFDLNLQAYWKNMFWIGIGYRNRPGIIASAGVNLKSVNLSYAIEIGAEKYSNVFNQIHEISISHAFTKKKKLPVDSLFLPDNQLIVKKDSLLPNTVVKALVVDSNEVVKIIPEKKDTVAKPEKSRYKLVDAGGGIYVVKSESTDSTDINYYNEKITDLEKDSIMAELLMKQIEEKKNKKINVVHAGSGVFTIKSSKNVNDSIAVNDEISEQIIDSLVATNDITNLMNKEKNEINPNEPDSYYTIQLFINQPDHEILSNSEIVGEIRIEKSNDGSFSYYYGYFSSETEAKKAENEFKKYKNLKVKIIKMEPLY